MRKLIISMNLSLDGYLSGPRGDLDWHFEAWNDEMGEKLLEHLKKSDTILLGRNTYEAMARYWPVKPREKDFPRQDLAIADRMNGYTKVVFTSTEIYPYWKNSTFTSRDPEEEIMQLKEQKGKNIILYGSGSLAAAIIQTSLVDEYLLWIHPVILGNGKLLFNKLNKRVNLKLRSSVPFESGVIVFSYDVIH
jgi:dihydrofolate reductase